MVTRTIINNFNSPTEQRLYEDLLGEFVQMWGIDVQYIPRISNSPDGFDLLFGDDPTKAYANNYTIECYVQSVDNYEGGEFYSKFGLQVKKQARLLMPNRAFKRETQGALLRPFEGDLIWLPNFGALFEIKKTDEEFFFFPFGKGATDPNAKETGFYGFQIIIEKFRYNNEKVTVPDVPEIGNVINSLIATYNFNMANTGTGTFEIDELVFQTANNNPAGTPISSGTVTAWNLPSGSLQLNTIQGVFLPNNQIFGANSGASWTLNNYNILSDVNNPMMDNPGISNSANTVLNFTEDNPFGQP
jgi:Virus neck protein